MKDPVVAKKGLKCVHYQELRNFYQEKCKKYAIRIRISRIVVVSLLSVLSLHTRETEPVVSLAHLQPSSLGKPCENLFLNFSSTLISFQD